MTNRQQPSMVSFIKDLPNICSLTGLLCTVFAIYSAIQYNYLLAAISILWAVLFDWLDGLIAKKMKGRTKEQGMFGGNLDSLIDMVSFGAFPAVLLLSYSEYNPYYIPGAFTIISACAIRLSYFNVFGLSNKKTYTGMPVDTTGILIGFIFLFEGLFDHFTFSLVLYASIIGISILNLSSLPFPKMDKKWLIPLTLYVIMLTCVFSWRIIH